MFFYSKQFILLLLLLNIKCFSSNLEPQSPSQQNNSNQTKKEEPSNPEMDAVTQQHWEVIRAACGQVPVPDAVTASFLYYNAPQEIRDFIEIAQTINDVRNSNSQNTESLMKAMPRRLLLVGPPGVGKSTLALVIAGELKRECYFVRTPMLGNEYLNSDTSNLIRFITGITANNSPMVIVLDEINIYAEKKNLQGNDLGAAAVLWLLLDKCAQNPNILIIGTCNSAEGLAPQLKDRFEGSVIEIPSINAQQRLSVLYYYLSRLGDGCSSKYLLSLANKTQNLSPRQLEALVNAAYQQSILRSAGVNITDEDLEKAYLKFVSSSKIINSKFASTKKWLHENGQFISAIAGSINLAALVGSIFYVACCSLFKRTGDLPADSAKIIF